MPQLSARQLFFQYCNSNRSISYQTTKDLAEEWEVKVETLTRRTRKENTYKGSLKFKKLNAEGKPIKHNEPWVMIKITGQYRLPTIFK